MTFTSTTKVTRVPAESYVECELLLDITSYTTNGESLATTLAAIIPNSVTAMTGYAGQEGGSYILSWDGDNSKLKAFNGTDGVEVTATTDIGTWIVRFVGY